MAKVSHSNPALPDMLNKYTILGNLREEHTEKWQRELFDDMDISDNDKFEELAAAGVDEIKWSKSLNAEYAEWQYLNLK